MIEQTTTMTISSRVRRTLAGAIAMVERLEAEELMPLTCPANGGCEVIDVKSSVSTDERLLGAQLELLLSQAGARSSSPQRYPSAGRRI